METGTVGSMSRVSWGRLQIAPGVGTAIQKLAVPGQQGKLPREIPADHHLVSACKPGPMAWEDLVLACECPRVGGALASRCVVNKPCSGLAVSALGGTCSPAPPSQVYPAASGILGHGVSLPQTRPTGAEGPGEVGVGTRVQGSGCHV